MQLFSRIILKIIVLWKAAYHEELTKRIKKEKDKARKETTRDLKRDFQRTLTDITAKHHLELDCLAADKMIYKNQAKKYKRKYEDVQDHEHKLEQKIKLLDKFIPVLEDEIVKDLKYMASHNQDKLAVIQQVKHVIIDSKKLVELK